MKNRICVISVYFGKKSPLFNYFIQSCKSNPEIDFYFFTDTKILEKEEKNVRIFNLSIDDFNDLVSKKLEINISISDPYKICDLRPAFGKIFYDYYHNYEFWGYCDSDIIFGKILRSITFKHLETYDVISVYKGFLSGPFCLFRNSEITINIYKLISNYSSLISIENNLCLDENINYFNLKGIKLSKFLISLIFIAKLFSDKKIKIYNFKEIRYQFQWFYKKWKLKKYPADFTEAVWLLQKNGLLKPYFEEHLLSTNYFNRRTIKNWRILWENGDLKLDNTSIFGFHFIKLKEQQDFRCPLVDDFQSFIITKAGITIGKKCE